MIRILLIFVPMSPNRFCQRSAFEPFICLVSHAGFGSCIISIPWENKTRCSIKRQISAISVVSWSKWESRGKNKGINELKCLCIDILWRLYHPSKCAGPCACVRHIRVPLSRFWWQKPLLTSVPMMTITPVSWSCIVDRPWPGPTMVVRNASSFCAIYKYGAAHQRKFSFLGFTKGFWGYSWKRQETER